MMKKLFTLFFALVASIGTMFASVTIDGIAYNLNETELTAEVTSKSPNYSGEIIIPENVVYNAQNYSVTSIEERAFYNCRNLTSVSIPSSVTSIGANAFFECRSLPVIDNIRYADTYLVEAADKTLSSYIIQEGTKWIGNGAFANCTGLTSITIPNSVICIKGAAFRGCSNLTSITIPNSVTIIEESAFWNCSSLVSLTIPNSVTSIGKYVLSDCTGLTSVTIGNGVTRIEDWAFRNCTSLISVNIPNKVTSIGECAFYGCRGLTSITIPNSVTNMGGWAFANCSGLTSISIPNSVTRIEDYTFTGCRGLTSITIPNSVTYIGKYAFSFCTGLTSITCNAVNPPALGEKVFDNVDKSIPLYVPAASVDLYKAADQWKDFLNILPIEGDVTGINQINSSSLQGGDRGRLILHNGQIFILRGDHTYTLSGQEVK